MAEQPEKPTMVNLQQGAQLLATEIARIPNIPSVAEGNLILAQLREIQRQNEVNQRRIQRQMKIISRAVEGVQRKPTLRQTRLAPVSTLKPGSL